MTSNQRWAKRNTTKTNTVSPKETKKRNRIAMDSDPMSDPLWLLMERPSGVRRFECFLSSYRKAGTGRDWIKLHLLYVHTVWMYKVNPRKSPEECRCWSSPPSNSKFSCIPTHHRIPIRPLANSQPSLYLPARSSWIQPGFSLDTAPFIGSMEFHTELWRSLWGRRRWDR